MLVVARGIEKPADLKGKKMGVPEYQQTAAIWTRGYLQHEYGVASARHRILDGAQRGDSQGAATGFKPPTDMTVHHIHRNNMGAMMIEGELDAPCAILPDQQPCRPLQRRPTVIPTSRRCFPTRMPKACASIRKTGIYPINHGMVIKREIAERHPWAVLNIFKAFQQANDLAEKARKEPSNITLKPACCRPKPARHWPRR